MIFLQTKRYLIVNGVAKLNLMATFLIALAVSADGLMVGLAYGIKKIRMPFLSSFIIFMDSFIAIIISMACGRGLANFLSPGTASRFGAFIIIIIGLFYLLQASREKINHLKCDEHNSLFSLYIKPLGIVVQILKEPSVADFDGSGKIDPREAFFLGLALAMDAFGAGFGLALFGFNILSTALTMGLMQFMLVSAGLAVGKILGNKRWRNLSSVFSGIILIAVGCYRFL